MAERISDAEYAVMEQLWRAAPLTANQVADAMAGTRSWSIQTVKTLLARLVAKGALATQADGRRFLYSPLIAREDHSAGAAKRLVDRLFGGRISPLVAQFADAENLSDADIAELKALIERLEK
ncbi:MAG: BlaI/MecI/CopY family transcriptional regulator [Sphingopyxis sp.]